MLLTKLGVLKKEQQDFITVARREGIAWADVTRKIPEPDGSVEVLYSSHMLEHLDPDQAMQFLREARRVLTSEGLIRLAVPNIRYHVDNYLQDNDADRFIDATILTRSGPKTVLDKVKYLFVGERHHQRMYDGASLCRLLLAAGFHEPEVMNAGTTKIRVPGHLDLREREPESVFVEAVNP